MLNIRHLLRHDMKALLLPQDCFLCGLPVPEKQSDSALICLSCADTLPRIGRRCPVCAMPTPTGERCGQCLRRPPHFDCTAAALDYAFPVDRLVQSLKYAARLPLARLFARCMLDEVQSRPAHTLPECIIAMPLHPHRLRERGFNQALEIAKHLSRQSGVKLRDGVRRVRDTPAQATLRVEQRHSNIRGAFACDLDLEGKSVAVVDDVMTTGSTLDELARTLKKCGAARVENWVVARTVTHGGQHV